MTSTKPSRWNDSDYDLILKAALAQGVPRGTKDLIKFLRTGQYVLPRPRQKTLAEFKAMLTGSNANRYRRRITDSLERIAPLAAEPPPPPKPPKITKAPPPTKLAFPKYETSKPQVRWTHRELALLARRIEHYRTDPEKAALPWGTLFAMAQEVELPPDRRRWHKLLRMGDTPSFKDVNRRQYEHGLTIVWTLPPFDADRTTWVDPNAEPTPAATAPPPPDWTATRLAAQAAQEAPAAVAAPLAAPQTHDGLAEALAGLAAPLLRYLDASVFRMMADQQTNILAEVDRRIDRIGKAMGAEIATALIHEVKGGIQGIVHESLEQELGGPVTPPAAQVEAHGPPAPPGPPDEDDLDEDAQAMKRAAEVNDALIRGAELGHRMATLPQAQDKQPKADKPMVDVIGLWPRHQEEVRKAVNGHADLRFVDPGHPQQWTHRCDNVVIVPRGAGAIAAERVRKAGVRPTVVNGGTTSVIHAIEEMLGLAPSPA